MKKKLPVKKLPTSGDVSVGCGTRRGEVRKRQVRPSDEMRGCKSRVCSGYLQLFSIYFAAIIFWQRRGEFDPSRVFIKSNLRLNKVFDVLR